MKNMSKKAMLDFRVNIPSLLEQQKIGISFQCLDTLIAGQKRKVALFKKLEKGSAEDF